MTKMPMLDQDERRSAFRGFLAAALFLALASAALMWSWNTIGHELFGGPLMQLRHGLALALALLVIAAPFRARGLARGRRHMDV
jgi:hypothetical protein